MVNKITSKAEFEDATKAAPIVVVDFYALWCGPCRMIGPVIEAMEAELETSNAGKTAFYKLDVDELMELAGEMKITAMPTFHIYFNGELHETVVGANEMKIRETINALMAKSS